MRFDKYLGDNLEVEVDVWAAGMLSVRPLLLFDLLLDVPAGDPRECCAVQGLPPVGVLRARQEWSKRLRSTTLA